MHSLTKSAIFFTVGHIAQVKGTQRMADMGGLTTSHPVLGWLSIVGLPPFGIFASEFPIATTTFARAPWLAILFVMGVLLALDGLPARIADVAFGEVKGPVAPVRASYLPILEHLALVLAADIWLPPPLAAWFQHVAAMLG